ncbi:MAG: MGMT family protein [Clostridia bacterium]|nr:MGMT family protein [Clostridia bacterium]
MANEDRKNFNARMKDSKNMPKIVELDDEAAKKWGGKSMVIAPPIDYDEVIKKIPKGKVITTNEIRKYIARKYNTELTCPLTAGIFINICAWASYQRTENITPYWRVLKKDGELNAKYPGNLELQKRKLEEEGHIVISKGTKNIRYFVENYENNLFKL